MNIDTGKTYKTLEEALADGVREDQLVSGTPRAIARLKRILFPKRRRMKMRRRK